MRTSARKHLLLAVKIILAVVLLGWVLSRVHWHDYAVLIESGESLAVVEPPRSRAEAPPADELTVAEGMLWWRRTTTRPVEDFRPVDPDRPDRVVRRGFATSLENVDPLILSAALASFGLSLLTISVRWWYLLRVQEIRIRLWESVRLTFLGQFFNAVVPGTVGGDLVKAYYVSRHTPKTAAVLVSIFVDRVMGLTELTALAAVMVVAVWATGLADAEALRKPAIAVAVVVCFVALTLAFVLSRRFRRSLHLQKLYRRLPFAHHITAAGEAAAIYRSRIGALLRAIAMTLGAHVTWIGGVALTGASLHVGAAWHEYFLYVPLIYIIGAVPITPGGVGLVEQLYVLFFAAVSPSVALALALLARILPMLWGLPGAVVAVTGPKLPKADALEAELGLADDEPIDPS